MGGASRRREGRACILEKEKAESRVQKSFIIIIIFFLNIVLTWKIVRVSEVLVLYRYIDYAMMCNILKYQLLQVLSFLKNDFYKVFFFF